MTSENGVHRWCVLVALSVTALAHDLHRTVDLYAGPDGYRPWAFGAALPFLVAGFGATALLDWLGGAARTRLPWWLVAGAAASVLTGALPVLFFCRGRAAPFVTVGCVAFGALLVALITRDTLVGVVRPALALGLFERMVHPVRLLALGLAVLAVFAITARAGLLRAGLAVGGALAATASLYSRIFWFLERRPLPGQTRLLLAAGGASVLVITGFRLAEQSVPARALARYPDDIVYARTSDAHDYVVTSGPGGFELYRDAQLAVSTLDEHRYAAALVRPVLGVSKNPARVLLLFGGTGTIEREILEDPRVGELTVVAPDETTLELARGMQWLRGRTRASLSSPRVRVTTAEPITWLATSAGRYDVVVANLPAPTGYREGKYYTRYFFDLVATHLAHGGSFASPAASAFASPEAFASLRATVASAVAHSVAYHADVPTLGVASFLVGSLGPLPDRATVRGVALDAGRDLLRDPSVPSTLYDQRVVAAFRERVETPTQPR